MNDKGQGSPGERLWVRRLMRAVVDSWAPAVIPRPAGSEGPGSGQRLLVFELAGGPYALITVDFLAVESDEGPAVARHPCPYHVDEEVESE